MAKPPNTELPWMPWYRGDYLRVTVGWPPVRRLVYFELLGAQWDLRILPADVDELRALVPGVSARSFSAVWRHIERYFPLVENGRSNYPLEITRGESLEIKKSRSRAARHAAKARWNGAQVEPD